MPSHCAPLAEAHSGRPPDSSARRSTRPGAFFGNGFPVPRREHERRLGGRRACPLELVQRPRAERNSELAARLDPRRGDRPPCYVHVDLVPARAPRLSGARTAASPISSRTASPLDARRSFFGSPGPPPEPRRAPGRDGASTRGRSPAAAPRPPGRPGCPGGSSNRCASRRQRRFRCRVVTGSPSSAGAV